MFPLLARQMLIAQSSIFLCAKTQQIKGRTMTIPKLFVDPFGNSNIFITRPEVETGNISDTLGVLQSLLDDRRNVLQRQNKIRVFVDGYDDDSRELWDIHEVRAFYRKLDEKFPYWFWFCDKNDVSLKVISDCLYQSSGKAEEQQQTVALVDNTELDGFMRRHYQAVDELCEEYNVPDAKRLKVLEAIESYFEQYYHGTNFFAKIPFLGNIVTGRKRKEQKFRPYAYERFSAQR